MNNLKKTIRQLKSWKLLWSVMIDAGFFFTWGLLLTPFQNMAARTAVKITKNVQSLAEAMNSTMIKELIVQIGIVYLLGFLLYILFHGTAWWIARKMAGKKKQYLQNMKGFLKVNLLWGAAVVVNSVLTLWFDMKHSMYEAAGSTAMNYPSMVMNVILWATVLLAFKSYPQLTVKSAFNNWKKDGWVVLTCFVLFQAALLIPKPLYNVNMIVGNVAAFALMFPTLALIRVYAIREL